MDKLDKAKEIIKANFEDGDCGLYNVRNWTGDPMDTIYVGEGLQIDICYGYSYFEVFGLTDAEFIALREWYKNLQDQCE